MGSDSLPVKTPVKTKEEAYELVSKNELPYSCEMSLDDIYDEGEFWRCHYAPKKKPKSTEPPAQAIETEEFEGMEIAPVFDDIECGTSYTVLLLKETGEAFHPGTAEGLDYYMDCLRECGTLAADLTSNVKITYRPEGVTSTQLIDLLIDVCPCTDDYAQTVVTEFMEGRTDMLNAVQHWSVYKLIEQLQALGFKCEKVWSVYTKSQIEEDEEFLQELCSEDQDDLPVIEVDDLLELIEEDNKKDSPS